MGDPWISKAKYNQTKEEKERYDENYDRIFRKKKGKRKRK